MPRPKMKRIGRPPGSRNKPKTTNQTKSKTTDNPWAPIINSKQNYDFALALRTFADALIEIADHYS